MTDDVTAPRRQLGRALRKARTDANLTQDAVARRLGCRQAKINKIETTVVTVNRLELDKMLTLYGVPPKQADALRALAARGTQAVRQPVPIPQWPAFTKLSDLEPDAREILCWNSERLPRPLQSHQYLLCQFRADLDPTVDVTALTRHWKARTRIFTLPDPPRYRAILSESSMLRMPCGRSDLIIDQAEHLLSLLHTHQRLSVRILPFDAYLPAVDSDFEVLRFTEPETDFAYVECTGGARMFKTRKSLVEFAEHWRQLHDAALDRDGTVEFLEDLVRKTRARWRAERSG